MTHLALLWHMHQPFYEDLATGEHILPWVRLHAIKDYWGMVAVVREFPRVRVTFNLVPSLVMQIQSVAADRARDPHLAIGLKEADALDASERRFLVANAFHAPADRMIRPFPRYFELHARRHAPESFAVEDLRDLQVLHKLAWMDPHWLATDGRLRALVEKMRAYTETDKRQLREVELELLRAVIPAYRAAAEAGQIELSTSPVYHPILPLLCDLETHRRSHPHSTLPRHLFAHPEDAATQVSRALSFHRQVFGTAAVGVWPSEGAVSDEVLGILAAHGIAWTATDEEILARSLHRPVDAEALYRPYAVKAGSGTVRCLFRDHALSDLIGFSYQSWEAEAAADDFVHRVRHAGRRFRAAATDGAAPVVTVILDGENAWEHYAGGGRPFLRALYGRLERARDIRTVTMGDAAAHQPRPLDGVFPGSWINGDFYIWAGHADDHRAWAQLAAGRRVVEKMAPTVEPAAWARALEEILIAEGSDWFWWYGDDHSSDHDLAFDDLYRRHLRSAYQALGLTPPDDLYVSNITTETRPGGPLVLRRLASPTLDGRVTTFFEWADAADVPLIEPRGAMHRVSASAVRTLSLIADESTVYLKLDGSEVVRGLLANELGLAVLVDYPERRRIDLSADASGGPRWRCQDIVEAAVPFSDLGSQAGGRIRLSVWVVNGSGQVVEQQPSSHPLEVILPTRNLPAVNWTV